MLRATHLPRKGFHACKAQRALLAKTLPAGGAVPTDLTAPGQCLESRKGPADPVVELVALYEAELGFGVVEIEHVDRVDPHVRTAAIDLVLQKTRIHRVHPS